MGIAVPSTTKEHFFDAAKNGEIGEIKSYIAAGKDVNVQDDAGFTALHWAIMYQQTATIKAMLAAGADVTLATENNTSPLCRAAYTYAMQGAETATPLHDTENIYLILEALIDHYKTDPDRLLKELKKENTNGQSAWQVLEDIYFVKKDSALWQEHSKANERNAVIQNIEETILEAYSQIKSREEARDIDTVREEVQRAKSLYYSLQKEDIESARAIVSQGVNPDDYTDAYGWKIQHYAAEDIYSHMDKTAFLLAVGADPDARVEFEWLPRQSIYNGFCWKLEKQAFAYKDSPHCFNRSPLFLAVSMCKKDDVQALVEALERKYSHDAPTLIAALTDRDQELQGKNEVSGKSMLDLAKKNKDQPIVDILEVAINRAYGRLEKTEELFHAIESRDKHAIAELLEADPTLLMNKSLDGQMILRHMIATADADIIHAATVHILRIFASNSERAILPLKQIGEEVPSPYQYIIENGIFRAEELRQAQDALWQNVHEGNLEEVHAYLQNGSPLPERKNAETVLHVAAFHGHTNIVQRLLDDGRLSSGQTTRTGELPIKEAIQQGHTEIVKQLVSHMRAYYGDNPEKIVELLDRRDDIYCVSAISAAMQPDTQKEIKDEVLSLRKEMAFKAIPSIEEYGSFQEVINENAAALENNFNMQQDSFKNEQVLKDIVHALEEIGLRRFPRQIRVGYSSLVFPFGDIVVRLSKKAHREPPRMNEPEILQPLYKQDLPHEMTVEILPRVETKNVSRTDVLDLQISLIKRGLYFFDGKTPNIGKLPDGTPIIVDGGAVVSRDRFLMMDNASSENIAGGAKRINQRINYPIRNPYKYFEQLSSKSSPFWQWEGAQERCFDNSNPLERFIPLKEIEELEKHDSDSVIARFVGKMADRRQLGGYIAAALQKDGKSLSSSLEEIIRDGKKPYAKLDGDTLFHAERVLLDQARQKVVSRC